MNIRIQPIGDIDNSILEYVCQKLISTFGCPVAIAPKMSIAARAYKRSRKQYLASALLASLKPPKKTDYKILGVVEVDLYAPGLNFVFGQADMDSVTSIISLHRLRQEFYGLPLDEELFLERVVKESVHELGHTFGLGHCPDSKCVMHFSNSIADTDWKQSLFCNLCRPKLIP